MATGEMTIDCPNCGQRLRSDWTRCPRCRELVPEQPAIDIAEVASPSIAPQRPMLWIGAAAASLAALAIAGGLITYVASTTATEIDDQRAAAVRGFKTPPAPVGAARSVDAAMLAQHKSEDERRAGYAAYSAGDLDAALGRFQAAVDAKPDDPEARNNLGQVMVRQNRAADALPHFDEAIRLDPQKWAYRFNRARANAVLNQLDEAIADYRAAADMFPEDYATHFNLGVTYLRTKQYPEAVSSLERAVSLAPGESTFLISLGTAYVGVEQPDKAQETFQKFLEVAADDDPEVPRVKALIQALETARQGS